MTTTIDSGELSSAISKWQVSVTAEGYGTYIYTNSKENTEEVTYERNFNVSVSLISANSSRKEARCGKGYWFFCGFTVKVNIAKSLSGYRTN